MFHMKIPLSCEVLFLTGLAAHCEGNKSDLESSDKKKSLFPSKGETTDIGQFCGHVVDTDIRGRKRPCIDGAILGLGSMLHVPGYPLVVLQYVS